MGTSEVTHEKLTYHIPVVAPGHSLFSQHFYYVYRWLCKGDELEGNTMPGRLTENYLFSEANIEMNKDGEYIFHNAQ